ncbi:hypothetical protein [Streptomyces sp. NPDC002587]
MSDQDGTDNQGALVATWWASLSKTDQARIRSLGPSDAMPADLAQSLADAKVYVVGLATPPAEHDDLQYAQPQALKDFLSQS